MGKHSAQNRVECRFEQEHGQCRSQQALNDTLDDKGPADEPVGRAHQLHYPDLVAAGEDG